MRVLGIDPGSRQTGLGVVVGGRDGVQLVAHECLRLGAGDLSARLAKIFHGVARMIDAHRPHAVAIEQVFVSNNAHSAITLGKASGSAMCAAAVAGCAVAEYSARQIKCAVVGAGGAQKEQVQHMVRILLGLTAAPQADEADALACAICHLHTLQLAEKLRRASYRA